MRRATYLNVSLLQILDLEIISTRTAYLNGCKGFTGNWGDAEENDVFLFFPHIATEIVSSFISSVNIASHPSLVKEEEGNEGAVRRDWIVERMRMPPRDNEREAARDSSVLSFEAGFDRNSLMRSRSLEVRNTGLRDGSPLESIRSETSSLAEVSKLQTISCEVLHLR